MIRMNGAIKVQFPVKRSRRVSLDIGRVLLFRIRQKRIGLLVLSKQICSSMNHIHWLALTMLKNKLVTISPVDDIK